MGTIVSRKRKDGTIGHTAQIVRKKGGKIVFREAQTFDRKPAAAAWLRRREGELDEPGGLARAVAHDPAFGAVIDQYLAESRRETGRTKAQVLRVIKDYDLAELRCSEVTSASIVDLARALHGTGMVPATVANYLSHLSPVFTIARPAWGFQLEPNAYADAMVVCRELGLTGKSAERDRRPTMAELDALMEYFDRIRRRRPASLPMQKIVAFAIFSTRRQEEITRIRRSDYTAPAPPLHPNGTLLVRDMKHPDEKKGNHVRVDVTPEAAAIMGSLPEVFDEFFPFNAESISAAFTRACMTLRIDDLHFHDMRHEGISRLFEMGFTIPQTATISGHRSWSSLKRYSHLRQAGDKYADWKWLPVATASDPSPPPFDAKFRARHKRR